MKMNRLLLSVAVAASITAVNAQAQQNLGTPKNSGAYRTPKYQNSGALKVFPTGGQRHNNTANSGAFYFDPPARIYSKRKSGGSRITTHRKLNGG